MFDEADKVFAHSAARSAGYGPCGAAGHRRCFCRLSEKGWHGAVPDVYTVEQATNSAAQRFCGKEVAPVLRDITIGQYFPGKSVLHRMDPRMKIVADSGLYCQCCLPYPIRWGCALGIVIF